MSDLIIYFINNTKRGPTSIVPGLFKAFLVGNGSGTVVVNTLLSASVTFRRNEKRNKRKFEVTIIIIINTMKHNIQNKKQITEGI